MYLNVYAIFTHTHKNVIQCHKTVFLTVADHFELFMFQGDHKYYFCCEFLVSPLFFHVNKPSMENIRKNHVPCISEV